MTAYEYCLSSSRSEADLTSNSSFYLDSTDSELSISSGEIFESEASEGEESSKEHNQASEYKQPWPPIVIEAPSWPDGLPKKNNLDYSRLLSPGVVTTLLIVSFIGQTTIYYMRLCWPLDSWMGCIQMSIFLLWNFLVYFNHLMTCFTGPGILPKRWTPSQEEHKSLLDYCRRCETFKAPRSHHCSRCNRCVLKMDHHCLWVGTCVGHRNHSYFIRFLLFAVIGCLHAVFNNTLCLLRMSSQSRRPEYSKAYTADLLYFKEEIGLPNWLTTFPLLHPWAITFQLHLDEQIIYPVSIRGLCCLALAMGMAIGVAVALIGLLYFQLKTIVKNQTGIEEYFDDEAKYRRKNGDDDEEWYYPYNLGWKRNLQESLFANWSGQVRGNGIWWPVAEPCHQFTFSKEILDQKKESQRLRRYVRVTKNFSGGWLGSCRMFSLLGCKIFWTQPITDQTRVKLTAGEKWIMEGARKNWLYGYKVGEEQVKGWFPRHFVQFLSKRPSL